MSKLLEILKKDKFKSIIIGISSLAFIVGLVVSVANTGGTYAESTSGNYKCPLGNIGSDGEITTVPYYTDLNGYYCIINSVLAGTGTTNYPAGTSIDSTNCETYLDEKGYSYISYSSTGCSYSAIEIVNSCYYCTGSSSDGSNYFWGYFTDCYM